MVKYFEELHGVKSLSQLHKALQSKKRKQVAVDGDDDDDNDNDDDGT